ncbi:MAG: hypothetical protein EBU12_10330, partial [Microbacteriaceae bacterium]|nr:hypothetical protein [Microbacteriaceae bacterium]
NKPCFFVAGLDHRWIFWSTDVNSRITYWKQTSYNNSFRKTYATIGSKYDPDKNIFIAPKPFNSWILDTEGNWQAPISKPLDNKEYYWNEAELNWQEVT